MQTLRLAAVAVLVLGAFVVRGQRATVTGAGEAEATLTRAERDAGFTFGASVSPYHRQLVEQAVAGAAPAARILIERVDGITRIEVGPPPGGAAGLASGNADGFTVTLDLDEVHRSLGVRGVNRLVLHELGHVVDHVLVPAAMKAELDAAVPQCLQGAQPGCDQPSERFAESFAKWAMNDIGINLYIGYAVPPPPNLERWAQPLTTLES